MESQKVERISKLNTRYNGRIKKRKWEDRNQEKSAEQQLTEDGKRACTEPFERVKRKKVALLFAYSGINYFGMQRNPGMKTIEEDLLKALFGAKYITEEAFGQIQIIQFQRAARTDKGVSAVRQVVSLKMPDEVKVSEINELLPPEIRVFSIKRVTKGFNSKSQCDARTYNYILPTFSFEKHDMEIQDYEAYRTTAEKMVEVNEMLKKFEGTKNYHNFTCRKDFTDPSSKRYMMQFNCSEPFISNNMEFAVMSVKGQSFMMHQIRKMVGLGLAVLRGLTGPDTIERAFTSDRIDLPIAPGLGLVLDQVHYDRYNARYGSDGFHDTLTWGELDAEINEFKEKYIYPNILTTEVKEKSMETWLRTLPYHSYDVRDEDKKPEENEEAESDDECQVTEPRKEPNADKKQESKIN